MKKVPVLIHSSGVGLIQIKYISETTEILSLITFQLALLYIIFSSQVNMTRRRLVRSTITALWSQKPGTVINCSM